MAEADVPTSSPLCATADGLQLYSLIDRNFDSPGRSIGAAEADLRHQEWALDDMPWIRSIVPLLATPELADKQRVH